MTTAFVINPLVGYPTVVGTKKVQTFDWTAPNPYVVGGVSISCVPFGWGAFESGYGGVSESGTYWCHVRFSGKGAQQTCKVMVFVTATGVEATAIDLSAEIFRLNLVGE